MFMRKDNPGRREAGLTLIEMMVVISVLAIISSITLPNLLSSKVTANEAAVIGHLRSVTTGQQMLKQLRGIDNDVAPDGEGEYGYLAELAGAVPLRGSARVMQPPALSGKFGVVNQSVVTAAGYFMAMYLPDANGVGIPEDPTGGLLALGSVDPDLCEQYWVLVAWPVSLNTSGNRIFVVNQEGAILASDNRGAGQAYDGFRKIPNFDAAFMVANDMTSDLAADGAPAVDGGNWVVVK